MWLIYNRRLNAVAATDVDWVHDLRPTVCRFSCYKEAKQFLEELKECFEGTEEIIPEHAFKGWPK